MKFKKEKIDKIINLLQKLLKEDISCDYVEKELKNSDDLKYCYNEMLYNLNHYFSDEDIKKDVDYKNMQNYELKKMIYCLKIACLMRLKKLLF